MGVYWARRIAAEEATVCGAAPEALAFLATGGPPRRAADYRAATYFAGRPADLIAHLRETVDRRRRRRRRSTAAHGPSVNAAAAFDEGRWQAYRDAVERRLRDDGEEPPASRPRDPVRVSAVTKPPRKTPRRMSSGTRTSGRFRARQYIVTRCIVSGVPPRYSHVSGRYNDSSARPVCM